MKRGNGRRAEGGAGSDRRGVWAGMRLLENLESRVMLSTVTVSPVTVTEGDTTTFATLTAVLNSASSSDVIVKYSTANSTAKNGTNYTATSSTVTIPAGATSGTFTIPILANDIFQGTTKFFVKVSAGKGNTVKPSRVAVTVLDNDAMPTVTVGDASVDAGTKSGKVSIPVTLSNASSKAVKIQYASLDGTALKGKNYRPAKGTLSIKAGATTGFIKATVLKDTVGEADNVFDVQLVGAKLATLTTVAGGTEYARVVIRDAVGAGIARPVMTVSDATANAGGTETFNVTLAEATTRDVSVRYHTEAGTATAGDYTPVDGILTIPAGSTTGTITVATNSAGGLPSADFTLVLSAPANTDLASTTANGTIVADTETVGVSDASVTKGTSGTSTMAFTVTLSSAETFPVMVNYATSDGTAAAGTDYTATSGTLTFAPGETSETVDVTVFGNTIIALDKTLTLTLTDAEHAVLGTAAGTGTIVNNNFPAISIAPALAAEVEGNITAPTMAFTVTLSGAAPFPVTVDYATADGTAIAGTDYTAASGTVTFAPGETSATIDVTVTGESVGPAETFDVNLSNADGGTLAGATGVGTIAYTAPGDSSNNLAATPFEGQSVLGTQLEATSFTTGSSSVGLASVTIPLQMLSAGSATMMIYSDDGGKPGALAGTLSSPGSYSSGSFANATFTASGITLSANTTYWVALEVDGSGHFSWSATTGGTWDVSGDSGSSWTPFVGTTLQMQVTVDSPTAGPAISIAPALVTEVAGDITTETMAYTVTLSSAATFPVTVHYATADGTAIAGTDYTAASGTVTFAPGETSETIDVTVTGESVSPTETLGVTLANATNGTIDAGTAVGTIQYAASVDLSDNLAIGIFAQSESIGSTWQAGGFTTGSSITSLLSITLAGTGTATVQLYSDNGGKPGSFMGTLTDEGGNVFTASGITLGANSTYWVVVTSGGGFNWSVADASVGTGAGFTGASLASTDAGSSWSTLFGPVQMQVVTIENSDGPAISIAPASVTEIVGDNTTQTMTYTVTLATPAPFPVTVHYATADGTAMAGTDYTAASGTVTFAAGETSKTLSVTVTGDSTSADETFDVTLSSATNGTIATATGVGTIVAATDVSDNLAEAVGGNTGIVNNQWDGESFTTGSTSMNLESVTIPVQMNSEGSLTMMIYSDNSGVPGSLVGTLASPASYSTDGPVNATFTASGITLSANTTYWVVVRAPSGDFSWNTTGSGSGLGSGFTGASVVTVNAGTSWIGNGTFQMQVIAS